MNELLTRSFEFRADDVNVELREISGIAVPYDRDAAIGPNFVERIARDAVEDSDGALLFWRHSDPIGKLIEAESTADGWRIRAKVSDTALGNDAMTLSRDGVIAQLSIGFESISDTMATREDGTTVITRDRIRVREVSLVPFGAYGVDASITEVRHKNPEASGGIMTETFTESDLIEVRERMDDLERRQEVFVTRDEAPVADTRSVGEVLKAIAAGDDTTISAYNDLQRAYTGGTTADLGTTLKPGWVGDLTRLFDSSSSVLASVFSTGTLPSTGMSIEFAELDTNTLSVAEQATEGADIAMGKVSITTRTAPVKTYAGGTELTRQEIERASVGVLNTSLNGLALAAGARKKSVLRTAFDALVTARAAIAADAGVVGLGATLAAGTDVNWTAAVIDAAIKYEGIALAPEALIVSASVFKKLDSLRTSNHRVLEVADGNTAGQLNLTGLTGSLAGLPVLLDTGASGDKATFVNKLALRQYDSALVSLQDENILNLSKSFAVYRYGAVAAEIPAGVVPVKFGA
ncbi:HK97 family phage prohead protease [Leucobacter sp. W1153]|uniref:HK97 family phage prohead protease n=1 Tax=Leucobacter sp. W1153 TaxID=3439064 RepID=UPI003F309BE5